MILALWFDVLVHVWNGDLWCCDYVNESVDNNKKNLKLKQNTICDQMEVCVWASGWSPFTGSLFFSFVTLLPAHCSWENWRSTRHWLAHDMNTQV